MCLWLRMPGVIMHEAIDSWTEVIYTRKVQVFCSGRSEGAGYLIKRCNCIEMMALYQIARILTKYDDDTPDS